MVFRPSSLPLMAPFQRSWRWSPPLSPSGSVNHYRAMRGGGCAPSPCSSNGSLIGAACLPSVTTTRQGRYPRWRPTTPCPSLPGSWGLRAPQHRRGPPDGFPRLPARRGGIAVSRPTKGIRIFADGGYTAFRGRMVGHDVSLTFDHGPLGYLAIAAHGHADALSLTMSIDGRPVLVDRAPTSTIRAGSGGTGFGDPGAQHPEH